MVKKIQTQTEYYIQFSPEEIKSLGWEENQKLSITEGEDGSIILRPYAKVEVDLSDFSREVLEELIDQSCKKDISVNEVIESVLREIVGTEDYEKLYKKIKNSS